MLLYDFKIVKDMGKTKPDVGTYVNQFKDCYFDGYGVKKDQKGNTISAGGWKENVWIGSMSELQIF